MRRADRLFQIVQFLRSRRLTTAEWLAHRLEVSKRTIYRDISDLILSGIPVQGEAGTGYVLRQKLDLPPLAFSRDELTAIEIGLCFVRAQADHGLETAAMSKVLTALSGTSSSGFSPGQVYAYRGGKISLSIADLMRAIESKHKLGLTYRSEAGALTERVVWPLGLFLASGKLLLLAWCELRESFRTFRLDRCEATVDLGLRFEDVAGRRLADYFDFMERVHSVPRSEFNADGVNVL